MPKENKQTPLREKALAHLARREHSRFELAHKLEMAGYPKEEIAALLDDFEKRNWLSDQRFAESYVADHQSKSGPIKLAYELRQRGIPDSVIQNVLIDDDGNELDRAREVWRKKFGTPPANPQEKAKQMRFLQSRGFEMQTILLILGRSFSNN